MKIQLDTKFKTIKVEDTVPFSELVDFLEKILPKGEWRAYSLMAHTVINNWTNPVYIPYYYTTNDCKTTIITNSTANGTMNFDVQGGSMYSTFEPTH